MPQREEGESVTVYLGLGSNLGDRQGNISRALKLLHPAVQVELVSSFYETEPVGYLDQPRFINAVCRGSTVLTPRELLHRVKEIERKLGRTPSFPNAPRPIDIDILLYGSQVIRSPELTIPHPRLQERAFVLLPLAEIAPQLVHPVSQARIEELAQRVRGESGAKVISGEEICR
jgi:2-amino-4-hydroxy-6-hydroxymethyldihydropteridine diphosphokinase